MIGSAVQTRLSSFALSALAGLMPSDDLSAEAQYLRASRTDDSITSGDLDRYLANPAPRDERLLRLAKALGLTQIEVLVTALAAAVETDLMCGRAVAHLQAPVGGSRPTLGMLAAALQQYCNDRNVIATILTGTALESGFLHISPEGAPLSERSISVPVPICLQFESDADDARWPGTIAAIPDSDRLPLPPSVLANAEKHARALAVGIQRTLALRSGSMAEAKAIAAEIALRCGRRALFIDPAAHPGSLTGLAPWLLLKELLPVFCLELAPGERKVLPILPHYRGPQLATCGLEGSLEADGDAVPGWVIGVASKDERMQLWEISLGSAELARELSSHRHGSGRIAQLGRLARHQSILDGHPETRVEDILAASWTAEGSGLESLAQALPERISDEAMVMTPSLRDEMNRLLLRCRGREGLTESLGASASAKYRPGFRALFTGQSGTGKTLACGWLATRLGLPLYRVDLAAVTSKYIGETEKNLAQLLARAEHSEVILLFDEADSMFGKRTDVKESNDRFANAQTNYLLQRIETFDGIVFLTSNSRTRFDPAFFRRLDAIVDFPVPGPMERRSMWQSHLGVDHLLTPQEMNQLSAAADLLGGSIRNAVLTAAVFARSEHRSIGYDDILQAIAGEYRKLGRQVPSELQRSA